MAAAADGMAVGGGSCGGGTGGTGIPFFSARRAFGPGAG
jgi:hypothetical protein